MDTTVTAHEKGNKTRKTLVRHTRASRLNAIAREGYRALESLISLLARQYNSRVAIICFHSSMTG